jgi:D-alanyl-D-alanine carboxypeptidase
LRIGVAVGLMLIAGNLLAGPRKKAGKKAQLTHHSVVAVGAKLMQCYPDFIIGYTHNGIIWKDSTRMPYENAERHATFADAVENPSLADQFAQKYPKGTLKGNPEKGADPGRIRYEPFFYKMYGKTEAAVRKNLTEVLWCPKLVGQKILVTKVNGIDKKIRAISRELDRHPELKPYLSDIGGTFCWRNINGTNRQSAHSFGTTIDLNVKWSAYWQWDCKCTDEEADLGYRNKIPQTIVDIFERNGFIWGGKWYHYDTMHFEYRPDLL